MLKEASKPLKGNERYEGYGVDLIHELALLNGFNYTFKEQPDKSSGNPRTLPNGTRIWNGMIGEVQAGVNNIFYITNRCSSIHSFN